MKLSALSFEDFRRLPLYKEGESKEIRRAGEDAEGRPLCVIWLKPTIYSFTANRCAWLEGSNLLRARAMQVLIPLLQAAGIRHAYREIDAERGLILADLIPPAQDPNVEVIVKRYNSGTSYHRYYGLHQKPTRPAHPFWPGATYAKYAPFKGPKVRFDWRNPFWHPDKVAALRAEQPALPETIWTWPDGLRRQVMMRDEILGEDFAEELIDVRRARRTALWAFTVLQRYLARCDIVIYDLCLFITSDGRTIYGEINQDCGRFRHLDLGSLDKDVWRSGGSAGDVLAKWRLLAEMLESPRPEPADDGQPAITA